ncbi:50S ribosomal protein L10 [Candidatus Bathyarchaeota archaeon]|nr:MAG: 50S ribosomal protein L10 [Candidatus Bathyarchaeota archaeon]
MGMVSRVSEEKIRIVESTIELLKQYEIIGAADLHKVGSMMLQDLRRQLRGQIAVKCVKNTLMRIAMEKADLPGVEEFLNRIAGQNLFIFSNGNPFKLAMMLHRNKVKVFAKPGDIALSTIVIPAGNTGLSPGPILSKFGALGVRTRIEGGNIWVVNDTEVAKPGDVITPDLADILTRMGIRAAEMGLEIKAVYERGTIIPREELILDLDTYRDQLTKAYADAFQVALKAAYPTPQTVPALLALAAQNARQVALEAGYAAPETVRDLLAKAHAQALALEWLVKSKE